MNAEPRKRIRVFFRNDDVGTDEDAYAAALRLTDDTPGQSCGEPVPERLQRLVALFDAFQLPLDLGVIPVFLTSQLADWLKRTAGEKNVTITQHGWTHKNHGCREFGACRSYEQQFRDIERGKRVLEEALGPLFTPIFVPPSNRYDESTIRVLNELEFIGLSAGFAENWLQFAVMHLGRWRGWSRFGDYPISRHGGRRGQVMEFSTSVDVVRDYFSDRPIKSLQRLITDFRRATRFTRVVGIMLHHWTLRHEDEWQVLSDFLQFLKSQEWIEFVSLKQLCSEKFETADVN